VNSLTIKPPWSWAITHSTKRIENRGWQRPFRGTLAIHAGKGWDEDGQDSPILRRAWQNAGQDLRALMPNNSRIALGAVVAVADVVDICGAQMRSYIPSDCECGPWAARAQYHWRLDNVRALSEPVPCRGALGLWTLPDDVEAAVVAQLGEQVSADG
jgi:hypothetical protein